MPRNTYQCTMSRAAQYVPVMHDTIKKRLDVELLNIWYNVNILNHHDDNIQSKPPILDYNFFENANTEDCIAISSGILNLHQELHRTVIDLSWEKMCLVKSATRAVLLVICDIFRNYTPIPNVLLDCIFTFIIQGEFKKIYEFDQPDKRKVKFYWQSPSNYNSSYLNKYDEIFIVNLDSISCRNCFKNIQGLSISEHNDDCLNNYVAKRLLNYYQVKG